MKPIIRSILTPFAVAAAAGLVAWLVIQYQEKKSRESAGGPVVVEGDVLALRREAIDAAKKAYKVTLEAERIAYEKEKRESDLAELAELSHEVRILRIDLEHNTALAAIDKKYPPPRSVSDPEKPPVPAPPPAP
ncbi:MAG: hypothetical protein ABIZ81_01585 [Opitutaceae bacterium]